MRGVLAHVLSDHHQRIDKRSCKRRDSNERPKYQNSSLCLATLFFDSVLGVRRAAHCRSSRGGFHLSLDTTEMAEASFGKSAQFNNVAAICSKGLRDLYTTLH